MRRMMRALMVLIVLLAVAIGAGVAYLYFVLPKDRIVADLTERLRAATGRDVLIGGQPQIVLWPRPGIRTGAVIVPNPDWTVAKNLIAAQSGLVTVSIDGLTEGALRIGALHLQGGTVSLERHQDGRTNWPWSGADSWQALDELRLVPRTLTLRDPFLSSPVEIGNAEIQILLVGTAQKATYAGQIETRTGTVDLAGRVGDLKRLLAGDWSRFAGSASGPDLKLDWLGQTAIGLDQPYPYFEGRLEGQGTGLAGLLDRLPVVQDLPEVPAPANLELDADLALRAERLTLRGFASGEINGRGVSLDLRLGGGSGWQQTGDVTLNMVTRAAGLYSAYVDGPMQLGQHLTGAPTLKGSVADMPALLHWAGFRLPDGILPPQTANLTGLLTLSPEELSLDEARLRLDDDLLEGSGKLAFAGARPHLTLSTSLERLDVSSIVSIGLERRHFDVPTPAELPENGVDLSLEIDAQQLILGETVATNAMLQIHLRPDTVAVSVPRMRAFGGELGLDALVGDASASRVVAVQATGIDALTFFSSFGVSGIGGGIAGDLRVRQGESGLTGEGEISLFGGELAGDDLFARARGQAEVTESTSVAALAGKVQLDADRLSLSALRLSGSEMEMRGEAAISIGSGRVSGRLVPTERPGEAFSAISLGGHLGAIEASAENRVTNLSGVGTADSEEDRGAVQASPASGNSEIGASESVSQDLQVDFSETQTSLQAGEESAINLDTGPAQSPIPVPAPR